MSHSEGLRKDIVSYIPAKVIPAISGMVSIFLLTKILKESEYASYSFIIAIVVIILQLINGWLNSSIIYFAFEYTTVKEKIFFRHAVFNIQVGLFAAGSLFLFIFSYLGVQSVLTAFLSILPLAGQMLQGYFFNFFQLERAIHKQTMVSLIQSVSLIVLFIIGYFYFRSNLNMVLLFIFLSYFFGSLYAFLFSNELKGYQPINFFSTRKKHTEILIGFFKYGFPVCIWFFSSQFYTIGDRILLKYFNIHERVGSYTSFRDLTVGFAGLITMPILMASHPVIMKMWKDNEPNKHIEDMLQFNIQLIITVFVPFTLTMFYSGEWIINFFLGKDYRLEGYLMALVCLSILFGAISMYVHKGFEVSGSTKSMGIIALNVALISFVCNLLLLPFYGILAAALVSLISQILYIVIALLHKKNQFTIRISYRFMMKMCIIVLITIITMITLKFIFQHHPFYQMIQFGTLAILAICEFLISSEIKKLVFSFSKRS